MQRRNNFSEVFYSGFSMVQGHLGERHLGERFRAQTDAILQPYLVRNGSYRSNELLEAAYSAAATPAVGIAQLLSAAATAPTALQILGDLSNASWLDAGARVQILEREIELARTHPADAQTTLPRSLAEYESELLTLLLDRNDLVKAQALLNTIPAQPESTPELEVSRIVLAVRSGHLAALLQHWRDDPDTLPQQAQLDSAARSLQRATAAYTPLPAAIRPLLEFNVEQKQLANTLMPTDFLSLAEFRIATGDLPGALQLLNRLTLRPVSAESDPDAARATDVYVNSDSAATLLETTHHLPEAIPFLAALASAQPWNATYRLRLAEAQAATPASRAQAIDALAKIVPDPAAPYAIRVRAAASLRALKPVQMPPPGSAELALLLTPQPSAAAARQPYFSYARTAAAANTATPAAERIALLREVIAIDPKAPAMPAAMLALLEQQAASNDAPALIALFEHLQQTSVNPDQALAGAADDNEAEADANAGVPIPADQSTLPAIARTLSLTQRIYLATQVAGAYRKAGQPAAALTYFELALELSPQADPALIRQRDSLQAALELAQRNEPRRPLIHKALAQPNQVRPRLAGLAAERSAQETR